MAEIYDPDNRPPVRLAPRALPQGRNVLERADPLVPKVPTAIPDNVRVMRVPPGRAHGLERPEMRTKGERGTESRLPPPTRKSRKERPSKARTTDELRAAQLAATRFGR